MFRNGIQLRLFVFKWLRIISQICVISKFLPDICVAFVVAIEHFRLLCHTNAKAFTFSNLVQRIHKSKLAYGEEIFIQHFSLLTRQLRV